jgi:hypothetical protein
MLQLLQPFQEILHAQLQLLDSADAEKEIKGWIEIRMGKGKLF